MGRLRINIEKLLKEVGHQEIGIGTSPGNTVAQWRGPVVLLESGILARFLPPRAVMARLIATEPPDKASRNRSARRDTKPSDFD